MLFPPIFQLFFSLKMSNIIKIEIFLSYNVNQAVIGGQSGLKDSKITQWYINLFCGIYVENLKKYHGTLGKSVVLKINAIYFLYQ